MEKVVDFVEKEAPFQPNEKMYGFLLMAYSQKKEYEKVVSKFNAIKSESNLLSVINWNICLLSLAKMNKPDELLNEYEDFKKSGLEPSEHTFHAVIEGLMIGKQFDKAVSFVQEMKNFNIQPTPRTYTIIVNWYARYKEFEKANQIINQMKEDGIEPTEVTYTGLIRGYVLHDEQLEGFKLLKGIYDNPNLRPNLYSYTTLISKFNETKQYGYVIRLWKMLQDDTTITVPTAVRNYILKIIDKAGISLSDEMENINN